MLNMKNTPATKEMRKRIRQLEKNTKSCSPHIGRSTFNAMANLIIAIQNGDTSGLEIQDIQKSIYKQVKKFDDTCKNMKRR